MTFRVVAAAAVTLMCSYATPMTAAAATPVNRDASPEARALLRYLYAISGRHTLSGQHNYANSISRWTDRAYDFTGKYPAVFGQDFGFEGGADKDSIEARPALIEEAKRQYRNGAVVVLTWHALRPTDDEPVSFRQSVQGQLTDFEWSELLTPGTQLYERWCAQVDLIAGYLKQLRDARVPVLWRPYHELNGKWFWWGGRPGPSGSSALYRQLYDRFVNHHKLNNLIWVWNANAPRGEPSVAAAYADFFPGLEYADVLAADVYGEFSQSHYEDLLALAADKPVALGEVGAVPSPAVLKAQPKWTWFMIWSDLVEWANSVESLRETFDAASVLHRDDPQLARAMAAIRLASTEPASAPVTREATAEARRLLVRLYDVSGKNTLSGQENDPRSVSRSSEQVVEVVGRRPTVWGQDLGITKEAGVEVAPARQAIVEEAQRQARDGAIVSLSWHAVRPTDDEPASREAGPLTEFEWSELLTPGTRLHARWCAQVDAVAAALKQLQDAGVPVLWRPYPQSNDKRFWWAGRKGARGSAALYRQLFDRLTNRHELRNLIWVWSAMAPGWGQDGPGQYNDFFPGLACVDALSVDVADGNLGWRRDVALALIGAGKVIGLGLTGKVPIAGSFSQRSKWTWFLVSPNEPDAPERPDALRGLYGEPRVGARRGSATREPSAAPK
jgi:mannan endo-1,4-beta-mannosidase